MALLPAFHARVQPLTTLSIFAVLAVPELEAVAQALAMLHWR